MESDVMEQACYAVVAAACDNFTKVASRKRNYLNPILDDIRKLTIKYEKLVDGGDTNANPSVLGISDPTVVKTKGAPRKKKHSKKRTRHCSNCSSSVHTIRRCPTVNRKDGKSPKNDELTHSESSDNSAASECEKDDMASVETNGNETNPQFECRMKNKGKEKENFVAKKKGKRSNKR